MKLFHFSDEPDIQVFEPRRLNGEREQPALVWCIDEFHAPHYFFPRECPRVCIWPKTDTTEQDRERFFGHSATNRMVAIEAGWLDRVRYGQIYRYTFDPSSFELNEPNAGYYTTTETVTPCSVERIDDLLGGLTELGIEVRITPSLMPLKRAILASTMNFSMIRLRNAQVE